MFASSDAGHQDAGLLVDELFEDISQMLIGLNHK